MPRPNPMMAGRMNPMMRGMNPMMRGMNPMMRGMNMGMPRMMAQEGGLMALGEGFKSEELNRMAINMFGKELRLLNRDELEQLRDEYEIKKGRVEAQEGGLMASKILGDESDDISMDMFGKPVKELNPSEFQELMDYLDSLRKDFASTPSLDRSNIKMAGGIEMDLNNEIMEKIIDDIMEADPSLSMEEAIEEAKKIFDQMASRPMAGPRVMAQEGGLMDMGGMEKDYRNEGGFVPIGGQERADDVPARLSKNEFVFTADAVRNAGGGDIDKGAEVMENMMENLEKGGKVSEESQGLKGARDMFATAQRLEGVL
jgi:hypothetical protein